MPKKATDIHWAEPWEAVDDGGADLVAQLRRELSPGHLLHSRDATAVGRRIDCSDVLFQLDDGRFAVVHLTWSPEPFSDPESPWAMLYDSFEDFLEEEMRSNVAGHGQPYSPGPDGSTGLDSEDGPDDPADADPGEDSDSESDSAPASASGGGMTRREIATLICKALALLMFAQAAFLSVTGVLAIAFMFIAAPFRSWLNWGELYVALILSVPMFATVIVGVVYWKKSKSIASRMVSANPAPVTIRSITVQDVMMVAFSTAGVFILVDSIRDFVGVAFLMHHYSHYLSELWFNPNVWSAFIQFAIAAWLILGSRGIVGVIHRIQNAGVPRDGKVDDDSGPYL